MSYKWYFLCYSFSENIIYSGLSVRSGSYCTSAIVGPMVYGNVRATLFTYYPMGWTVKLSVVGTGILAEL